LEIEKKIYGDIALSQIPRILSFGDRVTESETFGCFDRNYWHYKQIDFANARWQESVLLLGLLIKYRFPENPYHANRNIREWMDGLIGYWEKIQDRNGFFSENYPHERSFVATSFSTYAITETLLELEIEADLDPIKKAGRWLAANINKDLANQVAGAAAALYNIYLISGDNYFKDAAAEKAEELLKLQTEDGYFIEYGGYDIGYLSICISYLAKYYIKSGNQTILAPLERAIKFVESYLDDYGSYDIEGTSRRTQYLYPHGFVLMGATDIIQKNINGLKNVKTLNPAWMDDRFCVPLTIDYLQAFLHGIE